LTFPQIPRGCEAVAPLWTRAFDGATQYFRFGRGQPSVASETDSADRAQRLADELEAGIAASRWRAKQLPQRPLVYFEEWYEPMISGIAWVSELIEAAGGTDIFADRAAGKSAKERIVTAAEVIARQPEIIIGSWCGKKFRPEKVAARLGFGGISAVRNGALYEIKSPLILQPGPAALTD
jgi:iron complex transport system substrate-binding protein